MFCCKTKKSKKDTLTLNRLFTEPPKNTYKAEELHIILPFFNFYRFENLVKNFFRAKKHYEELGAIVHVVELVLGNAEYQVTDPDNKRHLRLKTHTPFFQKENLINMGVENAISLYPDVKYLAWCDSDINFLNKDIVADTIAQLNHHPVVQMWSHAIDLGPEGIPLEFHYQVGKEQTKNGIVKSFAYCYHKKMTPKGNYGVEWHPGYAWAITRKLWEEMGGLYQNSILGAGDHHMAWAFINKPYQGIHGKASEGYRKDAFAWCVKTAALVKGDVGYVGGTILHNWHGRKKNRRYIERWEILVDTGYDPANDLRMDGNGQLFLTDRSVELKKRIREYFEQRNDDANTVEDE